MSGQKSENDGDVRVHGAIEVHPAPGLVEQHKTEREEDKTQKNREYKVSKWTLIGVSLYTGLTLLLVIFSAINNWIARDAMRQSQRPWIGPDIKMPVVTGPLIIDQRGMISTNYQMTAINYGSYGANNINFWAQLYIAQDITTINDRAKKACDVSTDNPDIGRIMFPGQERIMSNAWPAIAMDVIRNPKADPPQKQYQAYLLTCIGYRDQFRIPHHTGTIFRYAQAVGGDSVMFEITPNVTITGQWVEWHSFLD
jgi:hypothetical protein